MNRQINRDQLQQPIERLVSWRGIGHGNGGQRLRRDGQLIVQPRWSQVSESLADAAVKPSSSRIRPNTRNRH